MSMHRYRPRRALGPHYTGVSLTEVLMSLLIMSIGVVSLITLFPISTLRVIEATNMTNATVLRYNAEAVIDSQSELIFDPDPGQFKAREHLGENYIVDPLGFAVLKSAGVAATSPSDPVWFYGYNKPNTVTAPSPKRYPGLLESTLTEFLARKLVSLPDNFSEQGAGRAVVGSSTTTAVTLEPSVDLTSVVPSAQAKYQATLFNLTGTRSEVRLVNSVSQPSPHTLSWLEPLSNDFGEIGRVEVASNEEFYTWMLSVRRRASGPARVDVVVFIKRLIAAADADSDNVLDGNRDEQVYSGKMVAITPGTTTPNQQIIVNYTGDQKPNARRGGYLFDTKNCAWYRISAVKTEDVSNGKLTVIVDEAIRLGNTEDVNLNNTLDSGEDLNNNSILDEGGVAFPRGVVGVFPLELKVP